MIVEGLESILRGISPAGAAESFLWGIIMLFIIAVVLSAFGKGSRLVAITPTLLVYLGILGTFTGVVVGLLGFDTDDIDGSIDALLEGLKTAFITSLVGIFGSVLFKVLTSTLLWRLRDDAAADMGIAEALLNAAQSQAERMEALRSAIAGDEESSLTGQVRLFRSDARDRHDTFTKELKGRHDNFSGELWGRLENFADMLSKSATEQVINALKGVITDFNSNLTEQFGENFKALNVAVDGLVRWQENYRIQLEKMSEQYQNGVQAIEKTEASVAHISEESGKIAQTMESLKSVLEVNQHQIEELNRHLQVFEQARNRAVEAVPELQRLAEETVTKMAAATEGLATGINESTSQVTATILAGTEEIDSKVQHISTNLAGTSDALATHTGQIRDRLDKAIADLNGKAQDMMRILTEGAQTVTQEFTSMKDTLQEVGANVQTSTQAAQQQVAASIESMQRRIDGAFQEMMESQVREIDNIFATIQQAVTNVAERSGENINSQLQAIDNSMTQEVERVMEAMGQALASITGKFTSDYTKLVEAMANIVRQQGGRA